MKKYILISVSCLLGVSLSIVAPRTLANMASFFSQSEIGFEESNINDEANHPLSWLETWQRPQGPLRVGIQVGHWKNSEVPQELEGLKKNGGGATGGGQTEWGVALTIANIAAEKLADKNIVVDVLPATIPPAYYADAFISIHADGNTSSAVSGFKIASPRRDYSEKSKILEELLYDNYEEATGLNRDPSITDRMRGYYAFNWLKYEHAIHPMTPAVILETGFLTNRNDQRLLINKPEVPAQAIVDTVTQFLGVE